MPDIGYWVPPSEGLHMCADIVTKPNRKDYVESKVPHYRVYASMIRPQAQKASKTPSKRTGIPGFKKIWLPGMPIPGRTDFSTEPSSWFAGGSRTRLWMLCCCFGHFDFFRRLIAYPMPKQTPKSRIPPVEGEFFCPHMPLDEIRIKARHDASMVHMMHSVDYPRFTIHGTRHSSRGSRQLWKYNTCVFCYLMFRELIQKPMPLSHGYRYPVSGRWQERPYGALSPSRPALRDDGWLTWCRRCRMPTLQDDGGCRFLMHETVGPEWPYPLFVYCTGCRKYTINMRSSCIDCGLKFRSEGQ